MNTLTYLANWPLSLSSSRRHTQNKNFKLKSGPPIALGLAFLALAAISPPSQAIFVDLNTSALSGSNAVLEFDLFDGDSTANNTATISGIGVDSTGTLGSTDCSIGCLQTGAAYTINDSLGFGEFLQNVSLGNNVSFNLNVSNFYNAAGGGSPDRLVLSLLDAATNFTLTSTNLNLSGAIPVQDALLTVDYTGGAGDLIRKASVSTPTVDVTAIASPGPLSLILPWSLWSLTRRRAMRPIANQRLAANSELAQI